MESRDLVSSARPKEAELGGGRAEPEEQEQERAGLGPESRGDEVIGDVMGERWGSQGEGEGLEEQEFSIKEASFQEGSLKLKIQTTKRTKKPPKSLENYICPPEIRMTIRPPSGEGRGGRLGCRAAQDKGPPRKRTYERPFRAAEPREGGLLQLLGDVTPLKHQSKPSILHTTPLPPHTLIHQPQQQHTQPPQFSHQHTHSPAWATPPSSPANPVHAEHSREPAGANRSPLSDLAPSFLKPPMKRVPGSPSPRSFSLSPQRPLSPDPVLPVVTDASILNLTSLSRGRGLQEVSEQLFGNIKRKYGRKDPQRTLGNTHNAEMPWGRRAEKDAESLIVLEERQKYRKEETPELEREERESIGRTRKEEREMPTLGAPDLMEEGIGRKRRRRRCLQESLTQEDQSEQLQGTDVSERSESGPPEPKVAHKIEGNKMESHKRESHKMDSHRSESRSGRGEEGSQPEANGDRGERGERVEKGKIADKGEGTEIGERVEKRERGMSGADMESAMIQSRTRKNPVGRPRSATDPHKHPNPSPRLPNPSPNPNHIPSSKSSLIPNPRPPNVSPSFNPNPNTSLKPSPSPSPRPPKTKDRWSYLKSRSPPNLVQRESGRSPLSSICEPPSAFPITPSSPLYTNTDSLTVHTPAKRKRGRPKKQPLLTVETIHEGTSTSPLSPLARDSPAWLSRRRKSTLAQIASNSTSPNANGLKLKRGEGAHVRPVKRLKLGKVQSILNEILSCSSQHGSLALKSASAPVSSAMTVMASTIEARLGKQINVSKRGTIYIGKKRGRKPRSVTQTLPPRGGGSKPPVPASMSSLYNSLLVPSTPPLSSTTLLLRPHTLSSLCHPGPHGPHSDATMPSLQPISALPSKPPGRGLLGAGWKLSPPRLLANSPSHLSEGAASVKEVTLSPISESHSEETIPSDSGIGTDNNSTSDQTEKGTNARRRYSFDLCGFEAAEAAVLEASSRGSRGRCEQPAVVDNFLSQQEKKQKHRRKRKCLQSRDHLHFLSELEEVVVKLQQLHVSHRRYASCYPQHPYPSIFRLNFHHHYYPLTYDPYPCDPAPYLRRTAELKAKRRRGRPAKASEPITSKLPFVQGFGYPLAGGNYYAPYAMPYAPPLNLGYYPPSPPLYLPHHPHGPSSPSPFMRPAVPPPKFHSGGHSKLQASSGPLQGSSGRGEGLGSLGGGGLGGVRLHKRKHKHKHKHKEETNHLSPHDRQELGGLFSGAKTNGGGRGSRGGYRGVMFESNPPSSLSMDHVQFRQHTPGKPVSSFVSSYSSQSLRPGLNSDLFRLREEKEEGSGRGRRRGLAVFGEEGVMSFHNTRKEKIHEREESFHNASPTQTGVPGKRRYKRHEVEQIHGEVRRMCSLNNVLNNQRSFEHVQKILRVKRLQRQAKTGNNVVKRRPGRPRKHPIDESEPNNYRSDIGRGFGMPVLERCVDLPGRRSLRPSPAPQPLEFSNHDSISVAIETVVHRARSLMPPPTKGGKRRGRPRKEEGGDMAFH